MTRTIVRSALLCGVLLCMHQGAFSQSVQFMAAIIAGSPAASDTLYLGISGDGSGPLRDNTIGVDNNPAFGIYQESAAPPAPPTNPFDARFVTIPGRDSTYPAGLGNGTFRDFREFKSPAQKDSFRIRIEGDNLKTQRTVVSWQRPYLDSCAISWIIKVIAGGTPFPATDMLASDSVVIAPDTLAVRYDLLIIKVGAKNPPLGIVPDRAPAAYRLEQNFPNPFNPSTVIRFTLSEGGPTDLRVFNLLGQQIADLVNGYRPAGTYSVVFNASGLASGVYFYRLQSRSYSGLKRMLYLK